MRPSSRCVLLAAALTLAACSSKTSILVEVRSDLAVPADVDGLEIAVVGDAEGARLSERFDLEAGWPHSLTIRPGDVESAGVTIEVTALLGGEFVARRLVRSAFVAGEQVVVVVDIDAACRGVMCPANHDCRDGRCAPLSPMDGGALDGGVDGSVDAGCSSAAQCDDSVNCTVDTCVDGQCRSIADDSICEEGFTCDPELGCPARVCEIDSDCNDRVACNGAEACVDSACVPGAAIDCNDGLDCTSDVCSEAMRGECLHGTRDLDGDGFGDTACEEVGGVPATDCDDAAAGVNPDAPEVCNGVDDDCVDGCDDTFTCCRGETEDCDTACGTVGTRVCGASCGWELCAAPAEQCNGVDDDCNGAADDVFACVQGASEACTTSCGSAGTRTCGVDCAWSDCVAPAEVCNGVDDDCDGAPDQTFDCVGGAMTACVTSCGSTGAITCDATTCTEGGCVAPAEGCTGVDDDCDGNVDESVECSEGETQACTASCGSTGSRVCSASCTYGACTAPSEVCNSVDDDCDGRVDEDFTCVPTSTGACTTSCATPGTRTCMASCEWSPCTTIEACNGVDDDCDAMCDETFACCANSGGSCTTSCGSTGSRTCSGTCAWSACSPPAETCNGMDDDCNGACDDGTGMACCANTGTRACMTSCGSTGVETCGATCGWSGVCAPPVEACGGGDDDCDGTVDEGFTCVPSSTRNCTTSCGSTGTETCLPDCSGYSACVPPTEACNGVDDDCDTQTDEGCGACNACAGATTVNGLGGRYMVTLGAHAQTGSCGGAGSEGYLTFTVSEPSDVFITTHQAGATDTVVYVRECECSGAELGCNDDADGRSTSALRLTALAAGTYNIFVDTKVAMSGTVPVDVYVTAAGVESDRCGNPTRIAPGTTTLSGSTCAFSSDYAPLLDAAECVFSGAGQAAERVFYFYVPTARTVSFTGCNAGSDYDSTTYFRSVCTDATMPSQVDCNDDGCNGMASCTAAYRSVISTSLSPGLYYFFADGYDGTCPCGSYQYTVSGI